jgi:hypothetical protein
MTAHRNAERHAAGSIEILRLRRTITIIADIRIVMMSASRSPSR